MKIVIKKLLNVAGLIEEKEEVAELIDFLKILKNFKV
jgi:ATP-dependent Zn protease